MMGKGVQRTPVVEEFLPSGRRRKAQVLPDEVGMAGEKGVDHTVGLLRRQGAEGIEKGSAGANQGGDVAEDGPLEERQAPDVGLDAPPAGFGVAPQHPETAAGCVNEDSVEAPGVEKSGGAGEIPVAGLDPLAAETMGPFADEANPLGVQVESK